MLNNYYSLHHDQKDAVSVRAEIAKQLKDKGIEIFKIGLVLNISEYKVKQLLKLPS